MYVLWNESYQKTIWRSENQWEISARVAANKEQNAGRPRPLPTDSKAGWRKEVRAQRSFHNLSEWGEEPRGESGERAFTSPLLPRLPCWTDESIVNECEVTRKDFYPHPQLLQGRERTVPRFQIRTKGTVATIDCYLRYRLLLQLNGNYSLNGSLH